MKKFRFTLMAITAMAFVMGACSGGNAASGSSEESSAVSEETNVYKNEKVGFSLTLPEGFEQQNDDKQMEADRGGKVFLGNGCMLDATGKELNSNFTVEETLKNGFDYLVDYAYKEDGSELTFKELAEDHYLIKGKDEFGLRAQYKLVKNGKEIDLMFTYPLDKQAELDRDVDVVVKSLTVD